MEAAAPSLSQEHFLREHVQRLEGKTEGRTAIHLHMSKLRAPNRRPHHLRVAAAFLRPLMKRLGGQAFPLGNSDLVVIFEKSARDEVDQVLARLRLLFAEDPLIEGDKLDEAGRFASHYMLDDEYREFATVIERLYAGAHKRMRDAAAKPAGEAVETRPLESGHMSMLLNAIAGTDLSPLVRRQPICVVVPGMPAKPVLWEVIADLDEIGRQLVPGLDLSSDRWLRNILREAVLDRLLVWLNHGGFRESKDPLSIDASVQALMSDQFLGFDERFPESAKKRLVFELQEIDVFSDLGATMFVRDLLQDRGYRVCLDGLNHLTMPLIDRSRLEVDFVKLHWGPDFENDIRSDRTRELAEAIERTGAARVILYRADSARAIECGRALGVTLFQGAYPDSMLKNAPRAAAPPAGGQRKSVRRK